MHIINFPSNFIRDKVLKLTRLATLKALTLDFLRTHALGFRSLPLEALMT